MITTQYSHLKMNYPAHLFVIITFLLALVTIFSGIKAESPQPQEQSINILKPMQEQIKGSPTHQQAASLDQDQASQVLLPQGRKTLLFLGHGPQRLIVMVLIYLVFILKVGPYLMHKRQAFELRSLVRIYNFFNIFMNVWLAYKGIRLCGNGASFFNCHCLDRDYEKYSVYIDIFILSRVVDFLDTIFFVLRKKNSQITLLHVFHHATVPLVIYLVAVFSMTPFSGFLIVLNALVHVFMYTYYFLATFPTLAPKLWWKKYITRIQIGQFVAALIYFTLGYILLPRFCDNPPMVAVVTNLLSALVFLLLFLSFYSGAYKQPPKQQQQQHLMKQQQNKIQ